MKNLLSTIAFVCLIVFSGNAQNESIKQVEWLVGSWQGTFNKAPFYEAWRKASDSVLVSLRIDIQGTDTIVSEGGAIMLMKNRRGYFSKDAGWEIESLSDNKIVLKNDTLKYANKIIWSHSENDHWLTEIKNPKGTIHYDMVKVAWLEEYVNRFIKRRN